MGPLDAGLDFYSAVLGLRGARQGLLSADIANASTPGFKAVDLDFREALTATLTQGTLTPEAPSDLLLLVDDSDGAAIARNGAGDGDPLVAAHRSVKYQVGGSVTLDGNSVDLNYEKLAAAENALDYEAAANFTSQMVNMMMTAIKGSAGSGRSS
ncbi:MAG TPA: flagellar basal body rod protein FlgB [Stellaceae bacterium]